MATARRADTVGRAALVWLVCAAIRCPRSSDRERGALVCNHRSPAPHGRLAQLSPRALAMGAVGSASRRGLEAKRAAGAKSPLRPSGFESYTSRRSTRVRAHAHFSRAFDGRGIAARSAQGSRPEAQAGQGDDRDGPIPGSRRSWFRPGRDGPIRDRMIPAGEAGPGISAGRKPSVSWLPNGHRIHRGDGPSAQRRAALQHCSRCFGTHSPGQPHICLQPVQKIDRQDRDPLLHQSRPQRGELVTDPGRLAEASARYRGRLHVRSASSIYGVPEVPIQHGARPVSWHLFVRVRPPSRGGRMWNMTMGQPMTGHEAMPGHEGMIHDHR
jgi:hypothetical protein